MGNIAHAFLDIVMKFAALSKTIGNEEFLENDVFYTSLDATEIAVLT